MVNELDLEIPDDALAEIAEIAPSLTDQERRYLYWRSIAHPPLDAFKRAGYSGTSWRAVETRPKIRTALADLNEKLDPEYRVTLQKVVGILMEAIEMARLKEQPKTLVEAAKELANVTGVGAAAKIQIDQKTQIGLMAQREQTKALQHIPTTKLEEFIGIQRTLPEQVIDAEFEEVKNDEN